MSKGAPRIAETFEQQLDAIVHDRQFDGLEIVQHHARPVRGSLELSVTIDRPGGVDLALCERVAAYINASLGERDEAYTLEIESAGLDRPLYREGDYDRFAGRRVRVVTSLTINGAKTHRGVLRGLRGEAVVVDTADGELLLPLAAIKSTRLEFDPREDFQRDKQQRKQFHGNSRKHGN
jgi:ribosome maturation factor RimP